MHRHGVQDQVPRRTVIGGLGAFFGNSLIGRRGKRRDAKPKACRLSILIEHELDDYESKAAAIASLLACLGMDEDFNFGSPRDAVRMILAADTMICAVAVAREGLSVWECFGIEDGIIDHQDLARMIPDSSPELRRSQRWTPPLISRVLERADELVVAQFLKDLRQAPQSAPDETAPREPDGGQGTGFRA